jgi:hyperosmotically inducible periplasmic protein
MKRLTPLFITCLIFFGATGCENPARTSADAPTTTQEVIATPEPQTTEAAKEDAQSQLRRDQLNADIRAREERNNAFNDGKAVARAEGDLESEVRSKLEANIPNGHLTVEAEENGTVTVSGTVTNQDQLNKIERLAKEIKGVTQVVNKATIAQTKS